MLLGIDASRANHEQKTGVEWYAHFVIQELKKIVPPEVKVVLYTREPLKGELAIFPPHWQEKVLRWPPQRLWTQVRLAWEMWRHPPDALFVPAHALPLVCPKKTFITIHDLGGLRFPAGYSWFERWYARFATWFALRRATVFTPSEFSKNEIKSVFGQGKTIIVSNGFDNSKYHLINDKEAIAKVLAKYNTRQPYFLSVGRLEEKKNTVGTIEAFGLFKERSITDYKLQTTNYKLVLLGKPGYGYIRVQAAIARSPYKRDIILPGWVDTDDVPYLLAGAAAFIFPSFYEGFGIPVLEAMACGVPVIASDIPSHREVAGEAAVFVDPLSIESISEGIKKIIDDSRLRNELIAKGGEQIKEFSWAKTAQKTWQTIHELV